MNSHSDGRRAAEIATSETLLRHGETAAKAGEFTSASLFLMAMNENAMFGAVFGARILEETIQRERARQDHIPDVRKSIARKSRKAA